TGRLRPLIEDSDRAHRSSRRLSPSRNDPPLPSVPPPPDFPTDEMDPAEPSVDPVQGHRVGPTGKHVTPGIRQDELLLDEVQPPPVPPPSHPTSARILNERTRSLSEPLELVEVAPVAQERRFLFRGHLVDERLRRVRDPVFHGLQDL